MLKIFLFTISFFLITIIFLQVPKENVGLASFATKSNILGSPSSAENYLNIFTFFGILLYLLLAVASNLALLSS